MDRYCLVISNGVYQNSADVFNILDDDSGGRGTFSVQLSSDGGATLTHWAAYTPLSPETYNALKNMTTQQFKTYVDQQAALKGRTPVGSITAFKGNLQMSAANADPWGFIASIGLVPVTVTLPLAQQQEAPKK